MAEIRMLSENVIGKIAAGEVVERPAAAIKELVENSLDAGARMILVDVQDGGITSFRVSDNGCGIEQRDIRMAFERHATSKIRKEEDLDTVGTLGFRGEALASIAAVGRVTLVTRTASDATGLKVQNDGGRIVSIQETACPVGTTITVKDLFYNVPVRRGFLKKPTTEAGAVSELMMRMILSRPDVSFRYSSNGKQVYHSSGDGQTASALLSIYGTRAVRGMREIKGNSGGVLVSGYVGIGENARSSRGNESFFINGRMMRSPLLCGALEDACRERVMIGKFPVCALYLEMPYEAVNVNVHPNKLEVRFRDDQAVRQAVFTSVFDALQERDAFERPEEMPLFSARESEKQLRPIPPIPASERAEIRMADMLPDSPEGEKNAEPPRETLRPQPVFRPIEHSQSPGMAVPLREAAEVSRFVRPESSSRPLRELEPDLLPAPLTRSSGKAALPSRYDTSEEGQEKAPPEEEPQKAVQSRTEAAGIDTGDSWKSASGEQLSALPADLPKPMKIFGALFDTFILIEYADHLLLVDQHAVHERLLYEKLMKEYEGQKAGQEMLVPVIVSLTKREQDILEENREVLEGIGLVTEPFGEQEVAIRSVPVVLGENETETFLREAIVELENGRVPGADKKRAAILQMACKHAVKGGEALTESELRGLVEEMVDRKVTPTCPHGRPLVISISHYELDKKFRRIQ